MKQIQRIKQKYGQQAEGIIADGLGLKKKGKKYHCPNIYAHRNADRDPSLSWDPKALQFYCFGCGIKIDIYGYYKEHLNYSHQEIVEELLGEEINYKNTSMQKNRDRFAEEIKKVGPITKECIEYIKSRVIVEETIKKFNLGTYDGQIAFPYYKYETIVGYKLRKPLKNPGKPKMTNIVGSKPYLYNIQNIDMNNKELIICEGEFDCMVIHQCGFTNVVSVGAGATSLNTIVAQAKDFLDKFEILIIVSDNDDAGARMDEFFLEQFGDKAKLIDKKLYERADINEEYLVNGKNKVVDLIDSARFKIEGRWDLSKKSYTGVAPKSGKYIPTGLPTIDYGINDLAPRFTTLIAGRTNAGKSTLVRQIIASAINKGNKVYLVNGEESPSIVVNKIYQCVIGKNAHYYDLVRVNKRYKKEPKSEVLEKLENWHHGKLVLFSKGESKLKTIDELTTMLEMEIKINNHNLIIVDNLMSILSVQASEKYEAQADFMQRLCDMARAYNTHVILVLHPNKTYRKGLRFDLEQISGASELYNKADNVIVVTREYCEEKKGLGIDGEISVLKNRDFQDLPTISVHYDEETELLLEMDEETSETIGYVFNWDTDIPEGFTVAAENCPFEIPALGEDDI